MNFIHCGTLVNHVAKWDGNIWRALGTGVDNDVFALSCDKQGNLYAGGRFNKAGDTAASLMAKWNGSKWSAIGPTIGSSPYAQPLGVYALACDQTGNVYAGGSFIKKLPSLFLLA